MGKAVWLGVAVFFGAVGARAQAAGAAGTAGTTWSAIGARTVPSGGALVYGEGGWPGLSLEYAMGLDARTDAGLRATFDYSLEGTTTHSNGVLIDAPIRRQLGRDGNATWAAHVDPGLAFYGNGGSVLAGLRAPIGVLAALQVDPALALVVGADLDLLWSVVNPFGLLAGPKVGLGVEWRVQPDVAITARARIGPEFGVSSRGSGTQLAFGAVVGVAFQPH